MSMIEWLLFGVCLVGAISGLVAVVAVALGHGYMGRRR